VLSLERTFSNDPADATGLEPGHGPLVDVGSGLDVAPGLLTAVVTDDPVTAEVARRYLEPLLTHDIDTLVLGCTHYPLLAPLISRLMAMAISRKAASAGFEWDDLDGVWQKVHEELDELKQAVASGDLAHAETELGDVLFTLVNVGRWCGLDPEEGLAGTNRRFLARFARVEAALGGELGGRSLAELEELWRQAKAAIRAENEPPLTPRTDGDCPDGRP